MKIFLLNFFWSLLIFSFHLSIANAQESAAGIWEGTLEVAPGTEITVLFDLTENADGSYSAILNSPDTGAIKDIAASSVSFDDSKLSIGVQALSGEYAGSLNNGIFEGEWTQPGSVIAMNLTPYVELQLSQAAIDTLLGQWNGKMIIPGGEFTILFHFELGEDGQLLGAIQNVDAGDERPVMSDIKLENGELFFRIAKVQAEYNGQVSGNTITGVLKQGGQELPLSLEKGEYVAQAITLALNDADMETLEGSWSGKLGPITLVFNFDYNDDGAVVATIDSPDQGAMGLKITSAEVNDGRLAFSTKVPAASFNGQIDGTEIAGEWVQGGMSNPLTVAKQ